MECEAKVQQYLIEQSWLGFEYFSDGVKSKSERGNVKAKPYVEESDLLESVKYAKAVDVEYFSGGSVFESIVPDFQISPLTIFSAQKGALAAPSQPLKSCVVFAALICSPHLSPTQTWSWRAPTPSQPGS